MSNAVPAVAYTNAILGLLTVATSYISGTAPIFAGSNLPSSPVLGRYGFFNAHSPVLPSIAISDLLGAVPARVGKRAVMVPFANIIRWQTDTQQNGDLIWPYGNSTAPT